ncbi:kinase-like protein [Lentithecium fluviatile CBS 122367]|uniref:Kinase-like protein n=1 Tax=Lentithecium fluviatile CBS 122367 TaxID=1168545 RepID=A0A6G1JEL2_9PLEO|nr:kinase-like protein [Lentithecium fluviatile CBS 122367]
MRCLLVAKQRDAAGKWVPRNSYGMGNHRPRLSLPPEGFWAEEQWVRLKRLKDQVGEHTLWYANKEIEAMKFLSHWHIVQILGCYGQNTGPRDRLFHILMHPVGDNDLATFLLEEFAQGDTPTKTLYRGWIEQWFLCLASALTYMHSEKVHHEDIKPSNIIHCGSRILFTDFSSSRRITAEDSTSTESSALASRMYAAPEAIPDYTNGIILRHGSRTDVFSLGLVFVEMLTVCVGESVEELRKYLFENTEGHDTQGRRQYHRAMPRLSTWFLGTIGEKMWSHLLRPMLRHERSDRPSAEEVFKRLSIEWRSQPTCTCHYDLPASAYIDTAQQDMKAVHESSLEDWVYIEKKPVNI